MLTVALVCSGGILIILRLLHDILSSNLEADLRWSAIRDGTLVAGAALGAPFIAWRTLLFARQTQIEEERQSSDIFLQAVALLGKYRAPKRLSEPQGSETTETAEPDVEVRVGAIYAISRLSGSNSIYYWQTIETLTSYVKGNAAPPRDYLDPETIMQIGEMRANNDVEGVRQKFRETQDDILEFQNDPEYPREDIQAALNTIAGRESTFLRAQSFSRRIRFKGACLQRADLRNAQLRAASLQHVRAEGADFRGAILEDADLYSARLDGAYFGAARFSGANLCSAILNGAEFEMMTEKEIFKALNEAFGDEWTILPNGIDRPKHWKGRHNKWQDVYGGWRSWRKSRGLPVHFQ